MLTSESFSVLVRLHDAIRSYFKQMETTLIRGNPRLGAALSLFTTEVEWLPFPAPREHWKRGDACVKEKELTFKVYTGNVMGFHREARWKDITVQAEPAQSRQFIVRGGIQHEPPMEEDGGQYPQEEGEGSMVGMMDELMLADDASVASTANFSKKPPPFEMKDRLHPEHQYAMEMGFVDEKTALFCTQNGISIQGIVGVGQPIEQGKFADGFHTKIPLSQVQDMYMTGDFQEVQ